VLTVCSQLTCWLTLRNSPETAISPRLFAVLLILHGVIDVWLLHRANAAILLPWMHILQIFLRLLIRRMRPMTRYQLPRCSLTIEFTCLRWHARFWNLDISLLISSSEKMNHADFVRAKITITSVDKSSLTRFRLIYNPVIQSPIFVTHVTCLCSLSCSPPLHVHFLPLVLAFLIWTAQCLRQWRNSITLPFTQEIPQQFGHQL